MRLNTAVFESDAIFTGFLGTISERVVVVVVGRNVSTVDKLSESAKPLRLSLASWRLHSQLPGSKSKVSHFHASSSVWMEYTEDPDPCDTPTTIPARAKARNEDVVISGSKTRCKARCAR